MATEARTKHPFYMYDAIQAQPQAFADVIVRTRPIAAQVAPVLAAARQIFVVGIGTSFHAVQLGQAFFYHYGVTLPVQAVHSFDFALYGPALQASDAVIVVSHRGAKQYSLASIKRAKEAGCHTVLITGEGEPDSTQYADMTIKTTAPERSSTFTVSYMGALAALAALAEATGHRISGQQIHPATFLAQAVPAALRTCLEAEPQMAGLAVAHLHHRRIWLAGAGPSGITAQEIALKIKEAAYLQAEGMSTETMLHGPFQCVEPADLFVLIAPAGAGQVRTLPLTQMVKDVGASYVLVDDGSAAEYQEGAAGYYSVPALPEPFTALTCLLPLQLFSYHLALGCGTDPDGFRLNDPRFASAYRRARL